MTTPDLPFELWLEILAYLPRNAIHKMVGVNRIFFELAMDDLYEEISFIWDDMKMLRIFEQLKFPSIARRVRRLVIRPGFLPALEDPQTVRATLLQILRLRSKPGNDFMPSRTRHLASTSESDTVGLSDAELETFRNKVLQTATTALTRCPNLHAAAIIVTDNTLTQPFLKFLNSLWSDSGSNWRSLSVKTTPAKLQQLLQPLVKSKGSLSKLDEFILNIKPSRVELTRGNYNIAVRALKTFLNTFRGNLASMNLSSTQRNLVESALENLQPFPNLRKLAIHTAFKLGRSQPEKISEFIAKHADILEQLTIDFYLRTTAYGLHDLYSISSRYPPDYGGCPSAFTGDVFPRLQALDITLWDPSQAKEIPDDEVTSPVIPNPSTFAPNITSLTLNGTSLSLQHISDLLNNLDGGIVLEELDIRVKILSPHLFDLLAAKLPLLTKLTVDYVWASLQPISYFSVPEVTSFDRIEDEFGEAMKTRRYHGWRLQSLRVTKFHYDCRSAHPRPIPMRMVAESLPRAVKLDCSYICHCHSGED